MGRFQRTVQECKPGILACVCWKPEKAIGIALAAQNLQLLAMTAALGEPEYCCAVLEDPRGWLWLQVRPSRSRHAADALTCFGGRREAGETAHACMVRELHEELALQVDALELCCTLVDGQRLIAFFYAARPRVHCSQLRVEAGSYAVAVPWSCLDALPVSPWHVQALRGVKTGRSRVEVHGRS